MTGPNIAEEPLFRGVAVALVTLFDEDGSLAAQATAEHASRLVAAGIRAILVNGTSGEATALTHEERIRALDAVRAAVPVGSGIPIMVGTGASAAREAVELTTAACAHGADAVLALSPPQTSDCRRYYDALAAASGDVPLFAYHYPAVSSPGIGVDALAQLPIAGLKDSTGDLARYLHERSCFTGQLYVGSPILALASAAMGSPGVVLALANAMPELCIAAFGGDVEAQLSLARAHRDCSPQFPSALKRLIASRWSCSVTARMGDEGVGARLPADPSASDA